MIKELKRICIIFINSQKTVIIILLILNLLQFREIGLLRIKLNEVLEKLSSIEQKIDFNVKK
jgi:hypothetical protein